MVVIADHDIMDTGGASTSRDVSDIAEDSGSIRRDVLDVNNQSGVGVQDEQINLSDIEMDVYRDDLEFVPSPKGTPFWIPYMDEDEKPKITKVYDTFDLAYAMYLDYSQKGRFNIKKSGIKYYRGIITHRSVLCNKAGKSRSKVDIDTLKQGDIDSLKQVDEEDEENDGKGKRKRNSGSKVTNCPAKIVFKPIPGTQAYKVHKFVEKHNHPLINENNMDLSRARRRLNFGDYLFIHRASLTNLMPTQAHRLKVALMGGYDKVRGTPQDWRNVRRAVMLFIGDRDAQMLVDKMINRKKHVPEFSFEHHVDEQVLVSMFWADETMKCNYQTFGDVVSFDATFRTNRYDFVFVPFTGIDHNQKCVTFGGALLSDETTESYEWMLKSFLKVHGKPPPLALTDQDAGLRKAIVKVFPDTHHRLCMWHITQKIPAKVLGDLDADSDFRKEFHKLIWNVYIPPNVFEERWNNLITKYELQENKWLSDMYAIRDRWIPGYFKEYPMCGLMKTTSRSESANAFFQIFSHKGNTFVQFMLCFESAMEKQRYTQRVMDNTTADSKLPMITILPIEQHASDVYTHSIFLEVQKEIYKGLYACDQISCETEGGVETCRIRQRDKISNIVIQAKVVFNKLVGTLICSCGHHTRHGYLCRHIFCVLRIHSCNTIPEMYIHPRWTKHALPAHLLEKKHRYGTCIEETNRLASDVHEAIEECVNLIRNDTDKLSQFLSKVNEWKKQLEDEIPASTANQNKEALFADLLGVDEPEHVNIRCPKKSSNRGSKRRKSSAEISKSKKKRRSTRKVPLRKRQCSICEYFGHYKTTCQGKAYYDQLAAANQLGEYAANEGDEEDGDEVGEEYESSESSEGNENESDDGDESDED